MKSNAIFIQNLPSGPKWQKNKQKVVNFLSTFPLSGPAGQKIPLKSHENSHKEFVPGRNSLFFITFYKTLTRSEENFKNVDYVYN